MSDTDVVKEATAALNRAVDVSAAAVRALVHAHFLTLSGQVPWHFQRLAAERAVQYLMDVLGGVPTTPTIR